jgi:2'-phosphotransferase
MANSRSDDHSDMAEEMDINMHSKEKDSEARFRSGRGGRRGKSSGGPKQLSREVMISKGLSKLLRHAANEAGLKLDAEGYAPLDQVVSLEFLFHGKQNDAQNISG